MSSDDYHVRIHEEDGSLWAEVRELPGCFASGRDLAELYEALVEAIGLYLAPEPPEGGNGAKTALRVDEITLVPA